MPNYQNGKIYAIRSFQTDLIYIGATTQKLSHRMAEHRSQYERYKLGKTNNCTSFLIIELGDAYIELIENFPCENKEILLKREGEHMRATKGAVNKRVEGRTKKEYHKIHDKIPQPDSRKDSTEDSMGTCKPRKNQFPKTCQLSYQQASQSKLIV